MPVYTLQKLHTQIKSSTLIACSRLVINNKLTLKLESGDNVVINSDIDDQSNSNMLLKLD